MKWAAMEIMTWLKCCDEIGTLLAEVHLHNKTMMSDFIYKGRKKTKNEEVTMSSA